MRIIMPNNGACQERLRHLSALIDHYLSVKDYASVEVFDLSSPPHGGTYRVLIVGDQPLTSLKFRLASYGFNVALRENTLEIEIGDKG